MLSNKQTLYHPLVDYSFDGVSVTADSSFVSYVSSVPKRNNMRFRSGRVTK